MCPPDCRDRADGHPPSALEDGPFTKGPDLGGRCIDSRLVCPKVSMNGRCETDPFDRAVDVCRVCYGEFCWSCLVEMKGRQQPTCRECALIVGGLRPKAKPRIRGSKKTVKARREALRPAREAPRHHGSNFTFFDAGDDHSFVGFQDFGSSQPRRSPEDAPEPQPSADAGESSAVQRLANIRRAGKQHLSKGQQPAATAPVTPTTDPSPVSSEASPPPPPPPGPADHSSAPLAPATEQFTMETYTPQPAADSAPPPPTHAPVPAPASDAPPPSVPVGAGSGTSPDRPAIPSVGQDPYATEASIPDEPTAPAISQDPYAEPATSSEAAAPVSRTGGNQPLAEVDAADTPSVGYAPPPWEALAAPSDLAQMDKTPASAPEPQYQPHDEHPLDEPAEFRKPRPFVTAAQPTPAAAVAATPTTPEPSHGEPTLGQPSHGQPNHGQPSHGQPGTPPEEFAIAGAAYPDPDEPVHIHDDPWARTGPAVVSTAPLPRRRPDPKPGEDRSESPPDWTKAKLPKFD